MKTKDILTLVILVILIAVFCSNPAGKRVFVPATVNLSNIPDPVQRNLSEEKTKTVSINSSTYEIKYMAEYQIIGKVASKRKYYASDHGDIEPYDFAMLWGELPNKSNDKYIKYSQFNRFYYYKYSYDSLFQGDYIGRHSANCHIVPANKAVLNEVKKVKKGDYIELKGYLINITCKKGDKIVFQNTSMTRDDSGAGACEIIYVTEIRFLRKKK